MIRRWPLSWFRPMFLGTHFGIVARNSGKHDALVLSLEAQKAQLVARIRKLESGYYGVEMSRDPHNPRMVRLDISIDLETLRRGNTEAIRRSLYRDVDRCLSEAQVHLASP